MKLFGSFFAVAVCRLGCDAVHLHSNASTSAIMLVAGISSSEELCLHEVAGRIGLETCANAVATGEGKPRHKYKSPALHALIMFCENRK